MTAFQSRKLVRDELVTLFTATDSWQQVWGYFPGTDAFGAKSPLLVISSNGTAQESNSKHMNPTSYGFLISNYVLAYRALDNYLATDAEDTLDALDLVVRQTIRGNMGGGTNYDFLQFDTATSNIELVVAEGVAYKREERVVFANLPTGAKT